jgi:hypothetical protein
VLGLDPPRRCVAHDQVIRQQNLETHQDHVSQLLQAYEASTLQSLTSYTYLLDAINALAP